MSVSGRVPKQVSRTHLIIQTKDSIILLINLVQTAFLLYIAFLFPVNERRWEKLRLFIPSQREQRCQVLQSYYGQFPEPLLPTENPWQCNKNSTVNCSWALLSHLIVYCNVPYKGYSIKIKDENIDVQFSTFYNQVIIASSPCIYMLQWTTAVNRVAPTLFVCVATKNGFSASISVGSTHGFIW